MLLLSFTHSHRTHITPGLSLNLTQLGHAYDAHNREVPCGGQHKADAIRAAKTPLELYNIIGWVACGLTAVVQQRALRQHLLSRPALV